MKSNSLGLFLIFCLVLVPAVGICKVPLIGKESLEIAEHHQTFAEFEKALTWCDKAISALNREIHEAGVERSYLARAYYLKAFVLVSLGKPDSEIEEQLLQALLVDSEFEPPESHISHPTIKKLLGKARAKFFDKVDQAFDLGMTLFTEEKFCEARDVLKPIANKYKNAELALKILKKCESKCQPSSTEPTPEEVQKEKKETIEEQPEKNSRDLLVFPAGYEESSQSLVKYIEHEKLAKTLTKYAPDLNITAVPKEQAEEWKYELRIDGYNEFVIEKGRIYMEEKREKLGDGIIIDMLFNSSNMGPVTVGGLIPRLERNIRKLFKTTNAGYLFFLKVEKSEFGGNPKFNLSWSVYSNKDTKSPVETGKLKYLNLIKSAGRYDKIGHRFQNYLKTIQLDEAY